MNKRKPTTSTPYEDFKPKLKRTKKTEKCADTPLTRCIRHEISSDGNCLFRAILYYLKVNSRDHFNFRQKIRDFREEDKTYLMVSLEYFNSNHYNSLTPKAILKSSIVCGLKANSIFEYMLVSFTIRLNVMKTEYRTFLEIRSSKMILKSLLMHLILI